MMIYFLIVIGYVVLLSLFYFGGYLWTRGSVDCKKEFVRREMIASIKETS